MHALIVVAHHHPRSLTHALAARIAEGVVRAGHSAETADLAAEGFEPRFGLADHAVHRGQASPPADVLAEQARIDRADTLVLVYPIYWWSMPALLKGWIDRVFSNGWAFDYSIGGDLRKAAAPARGAGRCRRRRCRHLRAARLRRGDAHPDRPWHLRLLRRTGGPFRTVAGVGDRRSDPASGPGPAHRQPALRRTRRAGAAQAQPLEA